MAEHDQVVVVDTSQPAEIVVRLIGDLDVSNVHRLREALEAIAVPDPHIVVDLADLTFMDSSGLGVLLEQHAAGRPSRCATRRTSSGGSSPPPA